MSGGGSGGRRQQQFTEINITPLTDVFLVLLVVMFLIAPLLDKQAALKIEPPSTSNTQSSSKPEQSRFVQIEVSSTGEIALDGEMIADQGVLNEDIEELLYERLYEIASNNAPAEDEELTPEEALLRKPKVSVTADDQVDYGRVVGVLAAVKRSDLGQVSLITKIKEER